MAREWSLANTRILTSRATMLLLFVAGSPYLSSEEPRRAGSGTEDQKPEIILFRTNCPGPRGSVGGKCIAQRFHRELTRKQEEGRSERYRLIARNLPRFCAAFRSRANLPLNLGSIRADAAVIRRESSGNPAGSLN